MTRVRTYLDPTRAEQLKEIAQNYGFDSVASYLDDHIATEWQILHPQKPPPLPGFEIYGELSEKNEPIVIFTANGTVPVTLDAIHAEYLGNGIDWVLNDKQKSFFIASMIDDSIIFFDKKGNGYRLMIKWEGGQWTRGLSKSLAQDLGDIFKSHSVEAVSKLKNYK